VPLTSEGSLLEQVEEEDQLTQAHLENGRQMETVTGIGNGTGCLSGLLCH